MIRRSQPFLPGQNIMALLAGLTALRLLVASLSGLVFDEAYYRLWALEPSFGYYDHAPMVAWWIAIGRFLIGDMPLGIRLLAVVSPFVGSLFLWRTAAVLFDEKIADRAVVYFNAMLIVGIGSIIITPDIPSVFFWGLTVWALAELWSSGDGRWWLVVGIAAGLGLLSKYSGVFLGAGIVVWLLIEPRQRHWFARWETWVGGAIALALFAPVIVWNAQHDFVSFAKQLGRTAGGEFRPDHVLELLGVQWLLMTPLVGVLAFVGLYQGISHLRRSVSPGETLLVATSLPFFIYLIIHALHDRVNGNWPAPLMPACAILAALAASRLRLPRLVHSAAPIGYLILALAMAEILHPFLPVDPSRNPAMLTQGWIELGEALRAKQAETGTAWIATASYEDTGALSFALRGKADIIQINERVRYGFLPSPDPSLTHQPALFIDWDDSGEAFLASHKSCYGTAERLGTVARMYGATVIERFVLYRLTDVKIGPAVYDRQADPGYCSLKN
jgi:4-amino-4-deoxy-L-arabinose transferase-like glycosyltransferase